MATEVLLSIFHAGRRIALAGDDFDDACQMRDQLADRDGVPAHEYEVLAQCPAHPEVAAVDCLDCGWEVRPW